jgi:CheY-like chemotaxis protein
MAPQVETRKSGAAESTGAGQSAGLFRALCVDDDDMVLKVLVRLLKEMDCVVTSATTAEQAWQALQAADYDLLVTDHDLPGMCGTELAVKTRQHGLRLPIIVMSGAPAEHVGLEKAQVPNSAFLQKPFGPAELIATVSRLQGRKRLGMRKH